MKNGKSAASKARSSQPAISPATKLQHDSNFLNAFQAIKEGMSVYKASRQYGVPESTLHSARRTRGKVTTDRRNSHQSSKQTTSPTARPEHGSVEVTQKKKSINKASEQDGVPESTLPDKARGGTVVNQRITRQSSKHTTSLTARFKHDAVQATQKRKPGNKASKQDVVPESVPRGKARGKAAANRRKPGQSSKPTISSTATRKYDETSLVNAFLATKDGMSVYKASKLYGVPRSTLYGRAKGNVSTNGTRQHLAPPTASRTARLQYAIKAVQDGMTIYKASRQFGVPESTLRDKTTGGVKIKVTKRQQSSKRRVLETPRQRYYDETKLINAFRAIQEGMSVYEAARQCGVPKSTLHDKKRGIIKVDIATCQQSSKPTELKTPRQSLCNETKWMNAALAIQQGASVHKAARQCGVPESTLRDKTKRKVAIEDTDADERKVLTSTQEQEMVDHLKHMANIGYQYSRSDLKFLAGDYANACGRNSPANKPLSDFWYYSFLKRWPDLESVLKLNKVSKSRYATQEASDNYFKELANILITNNLLESPERIYNIDGYLLSTEHTPTTSKAVITPPISIIGGGNASGYYIPPYFVIPGRWENEFLEGSPPGTGGGMHGWSHSETLKRYLQKHFTKHAYLGDSKRKGYKTLVLYDGRKYHISLFMAGWAKENHVILFVLPPGKSHVTEPQDAGLLGLFKSMYASECQLYHQINPGMGITKHDVAKLAAKPYLMAMSPSKLQAVFRKAGIYPFAHLDADEDFQVSPAAVISILSDDQDKQNSTMQQSPTADSQTNLDGTNIATPTPAFPTKQKRLTTFSDAGPPNKKSCKGIPVEEGSDDCGGIETPLPDPSVCAAVSTTSSVALDVEPSLEGDEEANCCVCGRLTPPTIKLCRNPVLVKWAQCDKCGHWTHLSFCTDTMVVLSGSPFLCPHCR